MWIFYNHLFTCFTIGESSQHLSLMVSHGKFASFVLALFVHAKCTQVERVPLWYDLLQNKDRHEYPWIVVGDFNLILNAQEKRSSPHFQVSHAWRF